MNSRKIRTVMLALAVAAPLAASPAFAGNTGRNWNLLDWWTSIFGNYQTQGSGSNGQSLPGPGVLGLVVLGLGTGAIVVRRRRK